LDTNALFFSKKLLPYLHSYEWALRKLIYLVSRMHFSDSWIEETIPKELISKINKKQKGKYKPENVLQGMDLFNFEEYLFGKNYISVIEENENTILRYKELSNEELLNVLQDRNLTISEPYSLWNEMFSKYMDVESKEIQADMELIREGRNVVSHNKEIESSYYQKLIDHLENYTSQLKKAFQKILVGEIAEENLKDMADDFVGYVDSKITLVTDDLKSPTSLVEAMNIGAKSLSQITLATDVLKPSTSLVESMDLGAKSLSQITLATDVLKPSTSLVESMDLGAKSLSQITLATDVLKPPTSLVESMDLGAKSLSQITLATDVLKPSTSLVESMDLGAKSLSQITLATDVLKPPTSLVESMDLGAESLSQIALETDFFKRSTNTRTDIE
jgi:hypothetical protein